MRQIFVNIYLVLLATFVVFLSVGVSISKMQCSKDGKIFIGAEIPNCMEKQAIACDIVLNEISCCQKEEAQESCCPQTNDNSCAGETANIQFDFETVISSFEVNFKAISILLYTCYIHELTYNLKQELNYSKVISLLRLYKPELAKIQAFLL